MKGSSALLFGTCEFTKTYLEALLLRSTKSFPFEEIHVVTPAGTSFPISSFATERGIPVHQIPSTGLKDWDVK